MTRTPSNALMAAAACLVTTVCVGGGVALAPSSEFERPTHLAASLVVEPVAEPREATTGRARVLERPPTRQKAEPPVTIKERPEPKPKPEPEPKPEPKPEPQPEPPPPPPDATFTISSFNVLGSSHTRGGGMLPGTVRIRQAASLLNIHSVDVAGLQEMQGDQYRAFLGAAGGTFAVYPGLAAGPLGVENSIVWRRSEWALEAGQTVQIPYFDGRPRPMPYVLLRHLATGRRVWVANFHNPASNSKRGNNDGHRGRAAAIETSLAARLWAETGYPVFVTGDMNDREAYFCRITAGAPMAAANGGSNDGGCRPPPYPMPVDWIFGSEVVDFVGYVRDEGPLVRRTSDHPMIRAQVLLDGLDGFLATD
ncbi:MAG: endonuclease/exonuclease/phosphatase family protein [Nocardioides sp.]